MKAERKETISKSSIWEIAFVKYAASFASIWVDTKTVVFCLGVYVCIATIAVILYYLKKKQECTVNVAIRRLMVYSLLTLWLVMDYTTGGEL